MIKSFTAVTNEIDDIELALAEISEQLDLGREGRLLKNTVAILACYAEYLDSGVVAALSARLPFEIIGATTNAAGCAGEIGETMLALLVLTSDDVSFACAVSDPIGVEEEAPLKACYEAAAAKLPGRPALMISFMPLLTNMSGDFYVDRMSAISGNVPNFGTLPVDHNTDYHDSQTIYAGQFWRDRLAILLFCGPVAPRFYVGALSDERVFPEKGAVTASKGNQLQTVNGISAADYLQSLGLTKNEDGTIAGINTFPIIVDYNDGAAPIARAMFALTPEGYAVCGGALPVGSTLSVGSFDPEEIAATTSRTLAAALAGEGCSVMLIYSCIGRFFALGYDQLLEQEKVRALMGQAGIPYLFAYSGTELCPVYGKHDTLVNRSHNNSIAICAF
jgi:hypothetical protein